jgi:hypothetical protein
MAFFIQDRLIQPTNQQALPNHAPEVSSKIDFQPDALQQQILDCPAKQILLCCSRQWGKSAVIARKALHFARTTPKARILIASASLRQATVLLDYIADFAPEAKRRGDRLLFPNGARATALPEAPKSTRGLSAHVLIIDEAAFVSDDLLESLTPTLATTNGYLWILSSAGDEKGFFYQLYSNPSPEWKIFTATAADCPRITKEFLDRERVLRGEERFLREYFCRFHSGRIHFTSREVLAACFDMSAKQERIPIDYGTQ